MPAVSFLEVTERAALKAKDLLAKRGTPGGAIRVKILAGACSGLSYSLEPTIEPPQQGDKIVESHGLKMYLDSKSLLYLAGSCLDYESTLMSQRFKISNPNAVASCSCGESFAV